MSRAAHIDHDGSAQLPDPPGFLAAAASDPPLHALPVLPMRATCGFPSPAEDFYGTGDELDLNQRCIRNRVATYFVEADTGTSMVDFGIFPGDTLVVDRSIDPKSGDIVMVLWDGGYMVKQLQLRGTQVQLVSGNPAHAPITVPSGDELIVWGVVTWAFRKTFTRSR